MRYDVITWLVLVKWGQQRIPWPSWTHTPRSMGPQGMRVVNASIMPDVVRANTKATIVMKAERIADWIKAGK